MERVILAAALLIGGAVFSAPYLQAKIDQGPPQDAPASSVSTEQARPATPGRLKVKADRAGHFQMTATINGRRIDVLADTGASKLALTHEDARRLGLRPGADDFTVRVQTANGEARAAPVTLREVRIGTIRVRTVDALVTQKGALNVNLLGMSFLGELSQFTMRGGELVMVQ